jgi:hypothetical protein
MNQQTTTVPSQIVVVFMAKTKFRYYFDGKGKPLTEKEKEAINAFLAPHFGCGAVGLEVHALEGRGLCEVTGKLANNVSLFTIYKK